MPAFVPATGPLSAKLAIIGEAPGRSELLSGEPFVGASGKLLWTLLARLGIDRSSVYCTNVIKVSAPASPLHSMPKSDLTQWRDILHIELQQLRCCNLYLALGATSLWALTSLDAISDYRGSILKAYNGKKLISTFHPAYILRQPSELHILQRDLQLAALQQLTPDIPQEIEEYVIRPTLSDCLQHLDAARRSGKYAFDIETARGGIITCISFAYGSSHTSICIPMHGVSYWSADEFSVIYKALQATLSDPNVIKIGQNVSYDIIGLSACGINVKPPIEDIMHMHHSVDPLAPHSLAFQASMFTHKTFWKEWDIAPDVPLAGKLDEHFDYNARDSDGTLELHNVYQQRFNLDVYNSRYKSLLPHLLQMYEEGLCLDKPLALALAKDFRSTASSLESVIATNLGVARFNINSSQQLCQVLYEHLNLPKQFNRGPGGKKILTADEDAIIDLYLETQNPFVLAIRDAKRLYKLATFLDPKSKEAQQKRKTWDGRLRCEYKFIDTGRLSSSASLATRVGINLQQIPAIVRQIIIPQEGYIFLEPDFSQAQARIIAWDSLDYSMMDLFDKARQDPKTYDIHWHNAQLILERLRAELRYEDRNACKHVVYGTYFDMKAKKLQATVLKHTDPPIYIDLAECQRRQNVFKSKVPKLIERQQRIAHEVLTTGKQVSPSGRVVTYHEVIYDDLKFSLGRRDYGETLRSAYSMIPQDIEALLMNKALEEIDNSLREANIGRVCLQVHDSILLEVKNNWPSVEQAFTTAQEVMERPYILRGESMVIPAEFKIGHHWPCGQPSCKAEVKDIRTLPQLWEAYRRLTQ